MSYIIYLQYHLSGNIDVAVPICLYINIIYIYYIYIVALQNVFRYLLYNENVLSIYNIRQVPTAYNIFLYFEKNPYNTISTTLLDSTRLTIISSLYSRIIDCRQIRSSFIISESDLLLWPEIFFFLALRIDRQYYEGYLLFFVSVLYFTLRYWMNSKALRPYTFGFWVLGRLVKSRCNTIVQFFLF